MINNKISILGCGWLGLPLAQHLLALGYDIKGSTTRYPKIATLKNMGIQPFLINLDGLPPPDLRNFQDTDVLIVNIPPGRKTLEYPDQYFEKMRPLFQNQSNPFRFKVIFASSTSVYGQRNGAVDEQTSPEPTTISGKAVFQAESALSSILDNRLTVIRFGGLIGPHRHPAKFLSGRSNIKAPNAPVNLVHLNDCIAAITTIIQNSLWGETFNVVGDEHPTKRDYYTFQCRRMGLPPPAFDLTDNTCGKTVENTAIKSHLKIRFSSIWG